MTEEKIKQEIIKWINEQEWNKMLDCQDLPNKLIIEKVHALSKL